MKRGHTRLALPVVVLLLSVACTSNKQEETPQAAQAPAGQPADGAGTEAAVTPAEPASSAQADVAPQPGAAAQAPDQVGARAAQPHQTARAAPAAPRAPVAPRPTETREAPAAAAETSAAARDTAREAAASAPNLPRPEPARMISIPAETNLPLVLQTAVASDTSNVEDRVSARVSSDVIVGDEVVIPEGARVAGRVTYAQPSAKVKGRAGLTVRFHSLTIGSRTYDIATEPVRREAAGTKAKDARDIGIGAGAGAVIGGIIGGRKGAGIGAAVGGAGGAGKVLATSGEEVRLDAGSSLTTRLAEPLVVDVRPGR